MMVDKNVVDWVGSQIANGYSEEQVRQSLLAQGHNQAEVTEALILSKKSPNPEKGRLFEVLCHIALVIFSLQLLGSLMLFPFIQAFIGLSNVTFYVLVSVYSFLIGLFIAYISSKISKTFKEYLARGIVSSSVLGFAFAVNGIIGLFFSYLFSVLRSKRLWEQTCVRREGTLHPGTQDSMSLCRAFRRC